MVAARFLLERITYVKSTLFFFDRLDTVAIERFQAFSEAACLNHENGYVVCDSGGKDSNVIKSLAYRSGVPFEIVHHHTTADHPLTVYYLREEKKRWEDMGIKYSIDYPKYKGKRTSMWEMIPVKGVPLRHRRWCCDIFKERGNNGRFSVTGVRWDESVRRKLTRATYEVGGQRRLIRFNTDSDARRQLTERYIQQGKFILNPIIEWPDAAVWDYIHEFNEPYNPLYDMGYTRVGCVGCPLSDIKLELNKHPEYKLLYIHAFQRYVDKHGITDEAGVIPWTCGEDVYEWWISNSNGQYDENQITAEEYIQSVASEDEDDAFFDQ